MQRYRGQCLQEMVLFQAQLTHSFYASSSDDVDMYKCETLGAKVHFLLCKTAVTLATANQPVSSDLPSRLETGKRQSGCVCRTFWEICIAVFWQSQTRRCHSHVCLLNINLQLAANYLSLAQQKSWKQGNSQLSLNVQNPLISTSKENFLMFYLVCLL